MSNESKTAINSNLHRLMWTVIACLIVLPWVAFFSPFRPQPKDVLKELIDFRKTVDQKLKQLNDEIAEKTQDRFYMNDAVDLIEKNNLIPPNRLRKNRIRDRQFPGD